MLLKSIIVSTTILSVSIGGCGRTRLPPPPVTAPSAEEEEGADPYAGMPEECRELMTECPDCDEVTRMRREILAKRCVPVCDVFLEKAQVIAETVPKEGVDLLKSQQLCGKKGATCSPIEESTCRHAVTFVEAGQRFRAFWAEPGSAPPPHELIDTFYAWMLVDYLDHQAEVLRWANANEVDPAPVLEAGRSLMHSMSQEALDGFLAEVGAAASTDEVIERRLGGVRELLELVGQPVDLSTFESRRQAAEELVALDDEQ